MLLQLPPQVLRVHSRLPDEVTHQSSFHTVCVGHVLMVILTHHHGVDDVHLLRHGQLTALAPLVSLSDKGVLEDVGVHM